MFPGSQIDITESISIISRNAENIEDLFVQLMLFFSGATNILVCMFIHIYIYILYSIEKLMYVELTVTQRLHNLTQRSVV